MNTLSVVGLGKLGLPLALSFAKQGFAVIGYDVNTITIHKLSEGISPIQEPHAQNLLNENKKNMQFTLVPRKVIEDSAVSFIVVPTPSKKDGSFSSLYIEEAIKSFIPYLKQKQSVHTFVITSTISPGTMDRVIKPLLEKETKKKVGERLGLCYSPELIALGSVIQNLTQPDFLFMGESDTRTGNLIESLRKKICVNKPKIIRTNWINAELIKLSLNAYITTKISFANMIARIAERIAGADSEIILNAIGQDSRIGTKYLKGGLGFGGPCFPRDNISLYSIIKKIGLDINLPLNTDKFNRKQIDYVYTIIGKYHKKEQVIGILGLSYKPETDVIDESQGVLLAEKYIKNGNSVIVFDPQVIGSIRQGLKTVKFMKTMEECVKNADIVVLSTPWEQFKAINWDLYIGKVIIDCWRMIDSAHYDQSKNTFIQLGRYIPSL